MDMLEIELLDHGNRDKLPRDFDIQVQMINVNILISYKLIFLNGTI